MILRCIPLATFFPRVENFHFRIQHKEKRDNRTHIHKIVLVSVSTWGPKKKNKGFLNSTFFFIPEIDFYLQLFYCFKRELIM